MVGTADVLAAIAADSPATLRTIVSETQLDWDDAFFKCFILSRRDLLRMTSHDLGDGRPTLRYELTAKGEARLESALDTVAEADVPADPDARAEADAPAPDSDTATETEFEWIEA